MICYHVDRLNKLSENQTINLFQPTIDNLEMTNTLRTLFPEGMSEHGNLYSITSFKGFHTNTATETIFELIRMLHFPNKVSRFQSFFAFINIQDAIVFSGEKAPIYKIEFNHDNYHTGDMTLLKGETLIQSYALAMNYWLGITTPASIIEILIKPPLKICNRVF